MSDRSVSVDRCLQCGKSRIEVKDPYNFPCATATGYEVVETLDEWERHHWRDWSDSELKTAGILPEFYDQHRRDSFYDLQYVECEHHVQGHRFPAEDVYLEKWIVERKGVCTFCGKRDEARDD